MNRLKNTLLNTNNIKQAAKSCLKKYRFTLPIAILGLLLILTVNAQDGAPFSFNLVPATDAVKDCLSNATARVTVFPEEENRGVDPLDLQADGLPVSTTFAVFLPELPVALFGAVQYTSDFTPNAADRRSLRVDTIIEEAFAF